MKTITGNAFATGLETQIISADELNVLQVTVRKKSDKKYDVDVVTAYEDPVERREFANVLNGIAESYHREGIKVEFHQYSRKDAVHVSR